MTFVADAEVDCALACSRRDLERDDPTNAADSTFARFETFGSGFSISLTPQYIRIYDLGGLGALNCAIMSLRGKRRVHLLRNLERKGFLVQWPSAEGNDEAGDATVVRGYDYE
jgi:hypothetical protein